MRLAVFLAAVFAWLRALFGPLTMLAVGASAFAITVVFGIDRLWPLALLAALLVGLAIGWAGLIATSSSRSPKHPGGDGEGESL
jgi:hypothetical protein